MVQLSNLYMTTGKTIALTIQRFYEDLQDLLELALKKDVLLIIGNWNAKVGSQEILEQQASLALEYKMKQGKG